VCADLGSAATCQGNGDQHFPSFAAAGRLTSDTIERLRRAGSYSVPDAVLRGRGAGGSKTCLHLLELKYCRDSEDGAAQDRAAGQHAALEGELRAAGFEVQLHTIALGIAGMVDTGMPRTLGALGVDAELYYRAL
jgi:hypothetical protein